MEESVSSSDSFSWLPVGYMIASTSMVIPSNFMEVDGQILSKTEYADVYDVLRGAVTEHDDQFVLPNKEQIKKMFSISNNSVARILIRVG